MTLEVLAGGMFSNRTPFEAPGDGEEQLSAGMLQLARHSLNASLLCVWLCVLAAVMPVAVFGQASYATPYTFTTIVGRAGISGTADGTNGAARFHGPAGLAVDSAGSVYVPDYYNNTIRKVTPIGTNWVVTTLAGLAGVAGIADGTNSAARFNEPYGLAVDTNGNVYVADAVNETIRQVTPVGTNWVVTTLAGKAGSSGSSDGTNGAARFNYPEDVAVDTNGNIYVADGNNNTIRKATPVGTNWIVTTLAGKAGTTGSADGTNGAARFDSPSGVAVDSAGNLYVDDFYNNTIRKVTPVGTNWVVTTLAGKAGIAGSADGTNSAARFNGPNGVALDSAGNVYVTDINDNIIRKVTPVGTNWVVTTLAGKAGFAGSADGTGSAVRFNGPSYVAVDRAGNLYVSDFYNNTIRSGYPTLMITSSGPNFGFHSGQFGFTLNGPGGQIVVVDASADLATWLPIWTNTLTFPAPVNFTDPEASAYSNRFYRARTP